MARQASWLTSPGQERLPAGAVATIPQSFGAAVLYQLISISGAVMVLVGYAALQRGWLDRQDRWFNLLNFVGSALLAWVAIEDRRWGFIALEVIWALLSIPPLIRRG